MTTKTDFTEEEWARLGRAPLVAGMAISLADPGGPIESIKESSAAIRTVLEAAESGGHGDLVQSIARDVAEKARARENPLAGFKPKGRDARDEVLAELREVNALLEKLDPEERHEYVGWLRAAAQNTATAAKEGGFLGFNAELVSEREQQMLDTLGAIFG